jgi:hypothetical protein
MQNLQNSYHIFLFSLSFPRLVHSASASHPSTDCCFLCVLSLFGLVSERVRKLGPKKEIAFGFERRALGVEGSKEPGFFIS